jgi:hypothetical protein
MQHGPRMNLNKESQCTVQEFQEQQELLIRYGFIAKYGIFHTKIYIHIHSSSAPSIKP